MKTPEALRNYYLKPVHIWNYFVFQNILERAVPIVVIIFKPIANIITALEFYAEKTQANTIYSERQKE